MKIILRIILPLALGLIGIVFAFSKQIEGEYDSPIIPALGDAIRLQDGEILHQSSLGEAWNHIGAYSKKNGNVELSLSIGSNKLSVTAHPTLRGLKTIETDRERLGLQNAYVLTRAIFGLNGR